MKRIIYLIFIFLSIFNFGQNENKWQPDSIYNNRHVKKIFIFMNSPKDLSEIIEFDKLGKRVKSTKYSVSYNSKTRKYKNVDEISIYQYDSQNKLKRIIDTISGDLIIYNYGTNGQLISFTENLGNFNYETVYYYKPLKSTKTLKNDSIIIYQNSQDYDKDFYVKRSYGYNLEPKLKTEIDIVDGVLNKFTYKDYEHLEKFENDETIINIFDKDDHLIKSKITSIFRNNRIKEYELNYSYYRNGLLKSIRGYVPMYFKYEFWK